MSLSRTSLLKGLSLRQLQYAAYMLGLPTAGNKKLLVNNLDGPRKSFLAGDREKLRIVSVDMGIRNLAYCVLDVSGRANSSQTPIAVTTWKRKDLTVEPSDDSENPLVRAPVPEFALNSPRFLSKMAFATTQELLSYQPDVMLIEQQRWRSAGAAGVQQWTIRVNSLEAMIWACWRTIQQTRPGKSIGFPDGTPMDPKRVAAFFPQQRPWDTLLDRSLLDASTQTEASIKERLYCLSRGATGKTTKAQKVAVVRDWLEPKPEMTLNFEGQAQAVAEFFKPHPRSTKRGTTEEAEALFGKLDDLADCLLQAITWYRWQENAQRLIGVHKIEEVKSLMRD